MCGIVGFVGCEKPLHVLIEGLSKLEYRGYDSAGIAVVDNQSNKLHLVRAPGKLINLRDKITDLKVENGYGISHTRWATHGAPTESNAHPHTDVSGKLCVVHNGIVENFYTIREQLKEQGIQPKSETDSEMIAHVLAAHFEGDLLEAVRKGSQDLQGAFSFVVMHQDCPDEVIAYRNGTPLVIGELEEGGICASDIPALLAYTRNVYALGDGELVRITPAGHEMWAMRAQGFKPVAIHWQRITWDPIQAEKGGYRHFMLKEIFEQPNALADCLAGRADDQGRVQLHSIDGIKDKLVNTERILILACGTSLHAGLLASYELEPWLEIPVEVVFASEFRYKNPLVRSTDLVIAISQSGETADTLAAVKTAQNKGATVVAICNVIGSMLTRYADATIYTHAGPEIGVASTKAFVTQVGVLYMLGLAMRRQKHPHDHIVQEERQKLKELRALPKALEEWLLEVEEEYPQWADGWDAPHTALYLGRGPNYPVALEGALKIKEISYIHAEGMPAGEMKHGPIALLEKGTPVVALIGEGIYREKTLSNLEEAKARGAIIYPVGNEDQLKFARKLGMGNGISAPNTAPWLSALAGVLPLQLLAYQVAVERGCDVDMPRNLAKSVTVE